jgi:hypothetical protein
MVADDFSSGADTQATPEVSFESFSFTEVSLVPESTPTAALLAISIGTTFWFAREKRNTAFSPW